MYDFEKLVSGMLALGGALGVGLCVVRFLRGRRGFQVLVPFWHYVCVRTCSCVCVCVCVCVRVHTRNMNTARERQRDNQRESARVSDRESEREENKSEESKRRGHIACLGLQV